MSPSTRSPFHGPEEEAYRAAMRHVVEREVTPPVEAWESAGALARDLRAEAAEIGVLGPGFPQECGRNDGDLSAVASQELALQDMGCLCSDTATQHFDHCRVPVSNLAGAENQGFKSIMSNFNGELIFLAAGANGFARVCLDEVLASARQSEMFGGRLIDQPVTRHKLADMTMRIEATRTMAHCASEAVQLHGGAGFIRGVKVERIDREVEVNAIGGGAAEAMRDLAVRRLGFHA